MDPSLVVRQFHPFVEKEPLNVHYQVYEADSSSSGAVSWNIDSPFAGALLDNEVYVEYTINYKGASSADFTNSYRGSLGIGALTYWEDKDTQPASASKLAPRQGWFMSHAMQNCEVVINGQSLRQNPYRYNAEFARFYGHPMEINGVCTMSGGELDSGTFTSRTMDSAGDFGGKVQNNAAKLIYNNQEQPQLVTGTWPINDRDVGTGSFPHYTNFPTTTGRYCNEGYTARCHRLQDKWRETAAADAADNHFTDAYQTSYFERLPISPFMQWESKDGKRSIPYVDKLELSFQFYSNAQSLAFQTTKDQVVVDKIDYFTIAPKLHLKWYIPPPGFTLLPELSIPVSQYKESIKKQILVAGVAGASNVGGAKQSDVAYENIRLQQVPDLMFIYFKPSASNFKRYFASEHHLEIEQIEITINGDSGKVLRASSGELFSMYVRNSPMNKERTYDYEEWRKRYCTLVFKPSDLGVRVPPGVNHGITLDVRCDIRNWWAVPQVNFQTVDAGQATDAGPYGELDTQTDWDMIVLSVYDKYELTLTNRGNAQLKLQNVPSLDMPQAVASLDRSELAAQFV